MKKSRYIVVIVVVLLFGGMIGSIFSRKNKNAVVTNEEVAYEAFDDSIGGAEVLNSNQFEDEAHSDTDFGDSLTSFKNHAVYLKFGSIDDNEDDDNFDHAFILHTYKEEATDTHLVVGPWHDISGKGRYLRFVVGVDTFDMDIRHKLPKNINLNFKDALPSCKRHSFSRHYALNEQSAKTDFKINIGIPDDSVSSKMMNLLSRLIRDDVADIFGDYSGDSYILPKITPMDMTGRSIDDMMRYYFGKFRKLYDKRFKADSSESGTMSEERGIPYSYIFYAYPVWQNRDSTWMTWKFYRNVYNGGTHGNRSEHFVTFDMKTGRMLGIRDFFTVPQFDKSLNILQQQLEEVLEWHWEGKKIDTELNTDGMKDTEAAKMIRDSFKGKSYPRPALTREGIVYSYQCYEKGPGYMGVLHFTQPYRRRN